MTVRKLDERVEVEMRRQIIVPGVEFDFYRGRIPGRGCFEIFGAINGASFDYSRERREIFLTLAKGDDVINVHSDGKIVTAVYVNDREYYNPEAPNCGTRERWQPLTEAEEEASRAVNLGKMALEDVHEHLKKLVPGVVNLMDKYFSRTLVPVDDLIDARPTPDIFANFNLKPGKT
jgi:hypothetical protein